MSSLARFLQPLPAARRAYSSFFSSKPGGGRYFNSARPTKTVVAGGVAKKSNRGTRGAIESGSSAGEAASEAVQAAQGEDVSGRSAQIVKAADTEDPSTTRTASSSGDGSSPTSPTGPREEPSRPFSLYESSHPHPLIESRDFKLHQFFSLHRPLLLLSDPASILQTAPRMGPLHQTEEATAVNGSEARSPGAGSMETVADADADAARQLTRALTLSQAGSAVAWENTLKRLGLDVNAQPDRIGSQREIRKVWRDIVMDSVKRKRRKKMKKHKRKKRRRLTLTQESLQALYDKLSRKAHTAYHGSRVGPGWLKYEFNDSIWNLDDDSDYTIFVWRQQQGLQDDQEASTSTTVPSITINKKTLTPTLFLHNPSEPIPAPPAYRNAAYYLFQPSHIPPRQSPSPRPHSTKSRKTKGSKRTNKSTLSDEDSSVPKFKREFEKFHSANGVRTVMGSIGPVQNVRMLLKSGYRHVYISREFAKAHGFIPHDAAPGHYGYGGLVNIGTWPITLTPSAAVSSHPNAPPPPPVPTSSKTNSAKKKDSSDNKELAPTLITVYLSEEPHFDVVLGRSFFERRQIQTNPIDPTDIVCLDTGEKIECELIILKDGKGEIVTVT